MKKTQLIYIDMGVLGEEVPVHVEAEWQEAETCSVEEGKKMEQDWPGCWVITDLKCELVPKLWDEYAKGGYTEEQILVAFDEQQ